MSALATPADVTLTRSRRDALVECVLLASHVVEGVAQGAHVETAVKLLGQFDGLFDVVYAGGQILPFVYGVPPWATEAGGDLDQLHDAVLAPKGPWREVATLLEREGFQMKDLASKLELLTESLRVDGGRTWRDLSDPVPRAAEGTLRAAADAPLIRAAEQWASFTSMIASPDQRTQEEGWRLRRVDVPVIDEHGRGALIGLQTWFPHADHVPPDSSPRSDPVREDPPAGEQPVATAAFREGVRAGHAAALALLGRCGLDPELSKRLEVLRFRIAGVAWPMHVSEGSAALPVALHVIQLATGLPALDLVASGPLDGTGRAMPMPRKDLEAKLAAVERDGRATHLAAVVGGGVLDLPRLSSLPASGELEEIVAAVWGEDWFGWLQRQTQQRFSAQDHHVVWGCDGFEPAGFDELLGLEAPSVAAAIQKLADSFQTMHPHAAVIGGPISSGKTWMARQVARALEAIEEEEWSIVWLSPRNSLLQGAAADELLDLVVELKRASGSSRVLIVMEDLLAIEGATDLARIATALETTGVSLLAVARYEKPGVADWRTGSVETTLSIGGPRLKKFAEELIARKPELAAARTSVGLALELAGTSVELLVDCLHACARSPEGLDRAGLQNHVLERAIGDEPLAPGEREQLRVLGANSMLRLPVPETALDRIAPARLDRLGARWHLRGRCLSSWFIGRALVQLDGAARGVDELGDDAFAAELAVTLGATLQRAMDDDDGATVANMLSAAHAMPALFAQLVRTHRRGLQEWARRTRPLTTAMLLRRCDRLLEHEQVREMTRTLAEKLIDGIPQMPVLDVAISLLALSQNRHHLLDRVDGPTGDGAAGNTEPMLVEQLGRALLYHLRTCFERDRSASVTTRTSILLHMDRFDFEAREELVCGFVAHYVRGARRDRGSDYRAVLQVVDQIRRALPPERRAVYRYEEEAPAADDEGSWTITSRAEGALLWPCSEVRDMLELPPAGQRDPGVYLGWLALKTVLERDRAWPSLFESVIEPLTSAIAAATPAVVASALGHLADVAGRPIAMKLLAEPAMMDALRSSLERGGASSAAGLIGTVTGIRQRAAYELIYAEDRPRYELVVSLARRIIDHNDAKGAGLALASTATVDDLFSDPRSGFANALATRIGASYVKQVIALDERTSIVFHLVRGLMLARATYLRTVMDTTLDHIVQSMRHDNRPSAPNLAVLILLDEDLGADREICQQFISRLHEELLLSSPEQSILLGRMLDTTDARSLAAYHQLADVIDADRRVQAAFARRYDRQLVVRLVQDGRIDRIADALASISWSLLEARTPDPSRSLFDTFVGQGWRWEERLAESRATNMASQVLDNLRKASPTVARNTVQALAEQPADERRRGDARPRSQLERIALRCFFRDVSIGVDFVRSVTAIDRARGIELMRTLRNAPRRWDWIERDIRHLANPATSAQSFVVLARADYVPEQQIRDRLWDVWQPLLGELRSPRALHLLLQAIATWDEANGRLDAAVSKIDVDGACNRIARASRDDLAMLPALVGTLWAVRRPEVAAELIAEAERLDLARRMNPEPFARLLELTRRIAPELTGSLAGQAQTAALRALERQVVPRQWRHWLAIGHLMRALRLVGHELPPIERPPAFRNAGIYAETWLLGWLPQAPWVDDELARRFDQMASEELRHRPMPLARLLTVASVHGQAAAVLAGPTPWRKTLTARPSVLAPLFIQAVDDPELARFIRAERAGAELALAACTASTERARAASNLAASALRTVLAEDQIAA